eukprot:gene26343-31822_t
MEHEERSSCGSERSADITTTTLSASSTQQINETGHVSARKGKKKRPSTSPVHPASIAYRGMNIYMAAAGGNLPVCVLLWGMASAKRVNLMTPDQEGNNALHFAAMADTPEVVNFLLQQTRGLLTDEIKLVDSRNHMGETPLMKCIYSGNIPICKTLLEAGSDLLVTDAQGQSLFALCARHNQLWMANYIYNVIVGMYSSQVCMEYLCTLDNEGHSALDYAADQGNVNMLEFCIRKGMNVYRLDTLNRSCLYWAVKNGQYDATRLLINLGLDCGQKDMQDTSPLELAFLLGHDRIYHFLLQKGNKKRVLPEQTNMSISIPDPLYTPPLYTTEVAGGTAVGALGSPAIYIHNPTSCLSVLLFGVIWFCIWVCARVLPWYVFLLLLGFGGWGYRRLKKRLEVEGEAMLNGLVSNVRARKWIVGFFNAPEKGLGFWLGTMSIYFIYLYTIYTHNNPFTPTPHSSSFFYNPMGIDAIFLILHISIGGGREGGVGGGVVNTRGGDFEEVLAASLSAMGPPPSRAYCRTTLVKKPIRSKYCVYTGTCIARFDHYCTFLKMCIGHRNHRAYVVMLLVHFLACLLGVYITICGLYQYTEAGDACHGVSEILEGGSFIILLLCAISVLAVGLLGALLYIQIGNMCSNLTVNERLNRSRYPYLNMDAGGPENPAPTASSPSRNAFDRGCLINVLEFWGVWGYHVDYTSMYDLPTLANPNVTAVPRHIASSAPPPPTPSHSPVHLPLTVQNMGRWGVDGGGGGRFIHALFRSMGGGAGGPPSSGPPSVDLEMVGMEMGGEAGGRVRGESADSADISGESLLLI